MSTTQTVIYVMFTGQASNFPRNIALDVSSVNQSGFAKVFADTSGTVECDELWLE